MSLGARVADLFVLPARTLVLGIAVNVLEAADVAGSIFSLLDSYSSVESSASISITGAPTANDTVTIDGQAYRFVAALAQAYDVLIGSTPTATAQNLVAAINGSGGYGATYGEDTLVHPTVSAISSSGTVTLTSKLYGADGDAITLTESADNLTVSGSVFSDGSDGDVVVAAFAVNAEGAVWKDGLLSGASDTAILVGANPMYLKAKNSGDTTEGVVQVIVSILANPSEMDGDGLMV
jgi:hypothetical protein